MNKVCRDKHALVRGNVHFPPDVGLVYALKMDIHLCLMARFEFYISTRDVQKIMTHISFSPDIESRIWNIIHIAD